MAYIHSVNLAQSHPTDRPDVGDTGIDKRPVDGPVAVRAPGPRGAGSGGIAGDLISDLRHHGGDDQAVYAYAREDLDRWATELDRPLNPGSFGENLTTLELDITGALIGERWQVGTDVVLEVSVPRVPCRTFASWLGERGWVATFTRRAIPGAYLRVVTPGELRRGDNVTVVHRPDHEVTIGLTFRAMTSEPELIPRLRAADALPEQEKQRLFRRQRGS